MFLGRQPQPKAAEKKPAATMNGKFLYCKVGYTTRRHASALSVRPSGAAQSVRRRPRLTPLGHLIHLADSALGRWFQEMMSNQFKPDQTGFGLLCLCVCVSVCVLGEVVLCDRMSAACICVSWSKVMFCVVVCLFRVSK